jgi:hypothetical protein
MGYPKWKRDQPERFSNQLEKQQRQHFERVAKRPMSFALRPDDFPEGAFEYIDPLRAERLERAPDFVQHERDEAQRGA